MTGHTIMGGGDLDAEPHTSTVLERCCQKAICSLQGLMQAPHARTQKIVFKKRVTVA